MKKEINLILRKQVFRKNIHKLFAISVIFFVVFFLISLALIFYNLSLKSQLKTLEVEEANLNNTLGLVNNKKAKIILLEKRLTEIDNIIKTRKNLDKKLTDILSLIPENLRINNLDLDENKLSLNINSDDLYAVDLLFEKISSSPAELKIVKNVNLLSFGSNPEKSIYNLSMEFEFVK